VTRRCVVIGAGGHAKVVIDTLIAQGRFVPVAATDPSVKKARVLGVPVVGGDEMLPGLKRRGVKFFIVGIGGVPDCRPRALVFESTLRAGWLPVPAVVHPSAVIAAGVVLGPGTLVAAQAVIQPDAAVGANVIVNTAAVVEHDCVVGDHVHVAPGARVSGGVRIGAAAFIGAGAVVREGVSIGARAVIGAGAVVLEDVAAGRTAVGVPARILRRKP